MQRTSISILGALAMAGCAASEAETADRASEVRSSPRHTPVVVTDACPGRRVAGIRLGSQCPAGTRGRTGMWRLGTPFDSQYHQGALPAGLDTFCAYTWTGSGAPEVGALPSESGRAPGDWLDADCNVVAPLGPGAFETALAPSLEDAFMRQVQEVDLDVGGSHERASLISVVDASPGRPGEQSARGGRSAHGYVVGRVARQLSCQDPDDQISSRGCMSYVDSPLALPLLDANTPDPTHGGYFGSQLDLAAGIFDAIARYDDQGSAVQVTHQIINLSVGWSPQWGGSNPRHARTPAPIRAVFEALDYARCTGALVVAAAGNATAGPGLYTSGLMFPAAWTTEVATCGVPLLTAVGGVDYADAEMAHGRPSGRPRLVAPAMHAAAENRGGLPGLTPVLSGTSVAAAVMSGAAAVVWGYRPELKAEEVEEIVYRAAYDLGQPADVCNSAYCGVRRISVCRALRWACLSGSSASCPRRLPECAPFDAPDAPEGGPAVDSLKASVTVSHPFVGTHQGFVPACRAQVYGTSVVPEQVCPLQLETTAVARPFVDPQPGVPVCPTCFLSLEMGSWTGYFEVNPELLGEAQKVSLEVVINGDRHTFSLSPSKWTAGEVFKVTNIPIPAGPVKKAALSYMIVDKGEDAYTNTEPLLVY